MIIRVGSGWIWWLYRIKSHVKYNSSFETLDGMDTKMDELSRAFYEMRFDVAFLKKKGKEFQDFFSGIMERCHPGDFSRVKPWGQHGDRKNDGYQKSTRTIYQVYAPNELSALETNNKIDEDFNGALLHWEQYFNTWVFVHNSGDGLGPETLKKLLELGLNHPQIKIETWGYEELRQKVFSLKESDIIPLFGSVPTKREMLNVRMDDLQIVISRISQQVGPLEQVIRPVPPDKLDANALSDNVEILLTAGMRKSNLVAVFFEKYHDPLLGEKTAEAFRTKYIELRETKISPDEIFYELQSFTGSQTIDGPKHQAAVLAIIAYFFEKCDIFEEKKRL